MTVKNFAKSIFKPFKKLLLTSEISPKWRKFAECGHTVGYTRRRRRRRRRHRRHRRRHRRRRRRRRRCKYAKTLASHHKRPARLSLV